MENITTIWSRVLELIKPDILPVSFSTWIETIIPVEMDDNSILLQVPYEYNKTMIQERYSELIKNSLLYLTDRDYEVIIRVKEKDEKPEEKGPKRSFGLNPFYTFENFIIGDSNEVAHANIRAAAKACIEGTYCEYNPLFIYGNAGLGKTHLMHAAGHKVIDDTDSKKNVLYVTSEQFTNELINSIKENNNQKFRDKYRKVDILMIDDIQFISNMPGVQKEIHHTFNDLYQNNKIIIISGDRPPKELHGVEDRLITRFESGVMCKIESPDFETRVAILKKKAEQLNTEMDESIYRYVAGVITTNNRELEGAMKKIVSLHRLIENVQRCDLSFLEEANAYYKLLNDFGYTQEQLAIKLGKNQSTIANKVRLLKLPRAVRTIIDEHGLTERHARALLRLPDADSQFRALDIILEKTLNVKQTDDLIEKMIGDDANCRKSKNHIPRVKDVRIFSNTIKKAVEIMNRSGKNCVSNEQEYDDRFEYNIKIYK